MDETDNQDLIVTDAVRSVTAQIRDVGSGKRPIEPPVEPNSEFVPQSASAPRPSWKQREQERAERREELRLAQAVERRRIEELAAAERAEQRRLQERQREREAAERRQQAHLVAEVTQQRRQELQHAAQAQFERRRADHFQSLQRIVDGLVRATNPPPEAESQVIYVAEDQGSPRLGDPNFRPDLMTTAIRWR
jgi:hypothetical protein